MQPLLVSDVLPEPELCSIYDPTVVYAPMMLGEMAQECAVNAGRSYDTLYVVEAFSGHDSRQSSGVRPIGASR